MAGSLRLSIKYAAVQNEGVAAYFYLHALPVTFVSIKLFAS